MNKDDFLNIDWVGRTIKSKSNADVTISMVHNSETREQISITFRNGCYELFTSSEHFKCAILKNRVLFKGAGSFDGIRLNNNKNNKTDGIRYARFGNNELCNLFRAFEGHYELKCDPVYDIYYIEKED